MSERRTFVYQYLEGTTTIDAIDDFIQEWHERVPDGLGLHEYLGLSWGEYARYVQDPGSLRRILEEIVLEDAGIDPAEMPPMCCRCYEEGELFPANCNEKPELLLGAPIGMYHCPDCGAMVIAGFPHPPLCKVCIERKHPGFDGEEKEHVAP